MQSGRRSMWRPGKIEGWCLSRAGAEEAPHQQDRRRPRSVEILIEQPGHADGQIGRRCPPVPGGIRLRERSADRGQPPLPSLEVRRPPRSAAHGFGDGAGHRERAGKASHQG